MNKQDISKNIRNSFSKIYDNLYLIHKKYGLSDENINQYIWSVLDKIEEEDIRKVISIYPLIYFSDNNSVKYFKVIIMLSKIQMYTDYYRYIKYEDIINDDNQFENYIGAKSYESISYAMKDDNLRGEMYDALFSFKVASAYDKVLLTKSLTDYDHEHLSKINPFYQQEKEKYDIDINKEFIIRQISKFQLAFKDRLDISYNETVHFLLDLYKINKDLCVKLINDIITSLNPNLFIDTIDTSISTLNIDDYVLDGDILYELIKDFYENEKSKKYELKEDKNANK